MGLACAGAASAQPAVAPKAPGPDKAPADAASRGAGAEREIRAQLTPRRYTTVAAEIGAKISRLPVSEGAAFRAGQLLVGVGEFGQCLGWQVRKLRGQDFRAVAITLGKDDIDTQRQRLAGLDAIHQPSDQIARPWPLAVLDQALAVDADHDDRLAGACSGHLPLVFNQLILYRYST